MKYAFVAISFTLASNICAAQTYPTKPVRLIVPFTPGGSTDILARSVAQSLSDSLNQPFLIDNRPGAGGSIGAEAAARAPADGYTLLMGHIGTLAVNPSLYPKLGYDPLRDFAPVTLFAMVPNILVVHPALPVRSVSDLVGIGRAKPGSLHYSSGGAGSAAHLAVEYLKLETGADFVHVPYKGTGPAVADLIGGQVQFTMTGLPPALQHVRAGKLRAVAVASPRRLSLVPDLPTVAESGVPGFDATQWYGVVAPMGTPSAIVNLLAGEVRKSLSRGDVRKRLEAEGAEPVGSTPAEFGELIRTELLRWRKVVQGAKLRPE